MEWKLPFFSWLKIVLWRGAWVAFLGFIAAVYVGRSEFNLPRETAVSIGYVTAGVLGLIAIIARHLGLVRRIVIDEQDEGTLTLTSGLSSMVLRADEVSAVITMIGTTLWGGELVSSGLLLVADRRRWRLHSSQESDLLFQRILAFGPYAWGFPMDGEIRPPQDVADSTHANAPERVFGRLRLCLARVMAGRLASAAATAALSIGLGVMLWLNRGFSRTMIWLLVLLYSAVSQFRAAMRVGAQIRQLGVAEKRLSGFE